MILFYAACVEAARTVRFYGMRDHEFESTREAVRQGLIMARR